MPQNEKPVRAGHNTQTVFRTAGDKSYTRINNRLLQDQTLSRRTKGLLVELLSHSENYDICAEGIYKVGREGRDQVWSMLREAQEKGFIDCVVIRDDNGRILRHVYRVTDDPQALIESTAREIDALMNGATHGNSVNGASHGKSVRSPRTGNPCRDNPSVENPAQKRNKGNERNNRDARAKNGRQGSEVDAALLAYNEAARQNGWSVCETFTASRRKRLEKRLADIGGLEPFKQALAAIPFDDFLMGKRPPKNGGKAFRLDLDRLCQTDGRMGDVLARLIDTANSAETSLANGRDDLADLPEHVRRERLKELEGKA
jgi:hypothetical protein